MSPAKSHTKEVAKPKDDHKHKNQVRALEEKLSVFQGSVNVLNTLTEFFEGLSDDQKNRLSQNGLDLESKKAALNTILLNQTTDFVNAAKQNIKEEFLSTLLGVEQEVKMLENTISSQKHSMESLNLLSAADVEKSLTPLHSKLKQKSEEIKNWEKTLKKLSPPQINAAEAQDFQAHGENAQMADN